MPVRMHQIKQRNGISHNMIIHARIITLTILQCPKD